MGCMYDVAEVRRRDSRDFQPSRNAVLGKMMSRISGVVAYCLIPLLAAKARKRVITCFGQVHSLASLSGDHLIAASYV
jgi:hypothetical protein